jgi:hypothetical protein
MRSTREAKQQGNSGPAVCNRVTSADSVRKQYRALLVLIVACVLFRSVLELIYTGVVEPYFAYMGFTIRDDSASYLEAWVLAIVPIVLLPPVVRRPSAVFALLFYLLILLPMTVLYGLKGHDRTPMYLAVASFAILVLACRFPRIGIRSLRGGRQLFILLTGTAMVASGVWLIASGAIAHFNLDPRVVYEQRAAVAPILYKGALAYVLVATFKAFGIGLLVYALARRSWWIAAIVVCSYVLFFGLTGHKSVLAAPFIVIGTMLWLAFSKRQWVLPVSFSVLAMGAWGLSALTNDIFVVSILVRRVFFIPAEFNFTYYTYFAEHGHLFWSSTSIYTALMGSDQMAPQHMISQYLTGTSDIWYNAGLVATGYMHAGPLGVLLYALAAAGILVLCDSLWDKGDVSVPVALLIIPCVILFTTADFTTTLLSHGLLPALVLLWFIREDRPERMHRVFGRPLGEVVGGTNVPKTGAL